jgi:hypothetical protein
MKALGLQPPRRVRSHFLFACCRCSPLAPYDVPQRLSRATLFRRHLKLTLAAHDKPRGTPHKQAITMVCVRVVAASERAVDAKVSMHYSQQRRTLRGMHASVWHTALGKLYSENLTPGLITLLFWPNDENPDRRFHDFLGGLVVSHIFPTKSITACLCFG